MRRLLFLCALFVFSFAAYAAKGPGAVRKQVESSLSVTGTIDITPAGDVVAHTLDQSEILPKGIVDMAARIVPQWKFEPVALQDNTVSRSKMNLLFVAKKLDNGDFEIDLRSATFSAGNSGEHVAIDPDHRRLPIYPAELIDAEITGTVFVFVKIGRDGKVLNADVSHVNLRVIGNETNMSRWRKALARNSLAAVRDWTFITPKSGPEADKTYWFGVLPLNYIIDGQKIPGYGKWLTYVPGPKTLIPWQDDTFMADGNMDALTPNSLYTPGSGRRLLTPLTGS